MKKLIAVLVALASLVTMLAACGKESGKKPCATHVDANKDLICDGCGKAVISIVEQLPPVTEPKVDMVVNPLPESSDLSQFWNTALVQNPVSGSKLTLIDGTMATTSVPDVFYIDGKVATNTDETEWKDVFAIYNTTLGKMVYSFESSAYTASTESEKSRCAVNLIGSYGFSYGFRIELRVWDTDKASYETSYQYYTFSGKKLADTKELAAAEKIPSANVALTVETEISNNGDYVYTVNGTTYVYDSETGEKIHEIDAVLFVDRPVFTTVIGNYGYTTSLYGDILVYDLTKWFSCVYAYEADGDAYVLSDGKILVQQIVFLPEDAVNYDYVFEVEDGSGNVVGSAKYDLVYTVINPVDGSETELEFGYYIKRHDVLDTEDGMKTVCDRLTVSKISGQKVLSETLDLIVDSSLNIRCAVEPWLPGQSVQDMTIVSDGVYLVKIKYLDGTTVKATVKADGTLLAYVPENVSFVGGFAMIGNKLYDTSMKLVLDLDEKDEDDKVFTYVSRNAARYLLTKDGDYYVLRQGATAPVKLTDENVTYSAFASYGYILTKTVDETKTAAFYNDLGTKLFEIEGEYSVRNLSNGAYFFTTENGNFLYVFD